MKEITTDRIVIVGAGLGALYAALELAPRPVLVIAPEILGQGASSAWAQGGVAAAMAKADSAASHSADTVRAGAGIVDEAVADRVTQDARDHILELTDLGTPFDRSPEGGYVMSREAAHSFARVVRVKGDQAGAAIMAALIKQIRRAPSVQILEGTMALALETQGEAVTGIVIQASGPERSAPVMLRGAAYLLAGGGSGGLYALTTNPDRIRGQVIGMAARAGAMIADAEFVQFHPTALDVGEDPAPLATEALRGEGATLINKHGTRFMLGVHSDAELAPRDVVAREIFAQTQAGNRPMLDTRAALGDTIKGLYPAVTAACARNGIDPSVEAIPVAAAAHYHMGGIATNAEGRSSLGNLWVCGEASSTGLHGANRLASNGLLEALVYARICAVNIAANTPMYQAPEVALSFGAENNTPPATAIETLRQTMTEHVGVLRNGDGLRAALRQIAALEDANQNNVEFLTMCATATLIAASALLREESRGAHERTDFPQMSTGPAQRSMMTLAQAQTLKDAL
ncbi:MULTISPECIES: L-aspartate oxidase [Falsihalocynthiibacter]|uniref:L-aspartate oxidase n=1 Tax=Falsihalocynthiibacter TaxID=2854182 RepID=UPI003003A0A4